MRETTNEGLSSEQALNQYGADVKVSSTLAWFVILIASLFFFYEFVQMNLFNAISSALMHDFSISAERLGNMSSFYFLANVIFLFPAGMLLDRCATRKVILVSLSVCVLGTACLGFATSFYVACACRFLTGIGSAFCFLSVIRLASRWFPPKRMALVIGAVVTMAMIGGMVAQTPMALLVEHVGWRRALFIDAGVGVMILGLIAVFVRDYPKGHHDTHLKEQEAVIAVGFWASMKVAYLNPQNWLGGIYACLMNLPIGLLGGLWGALYLVSTHHLTQLQATDVTSMLFLGTIIGAPIVGWISDKIAMRRPPMIAGAIVSLLLFLMVVVMTSLSYPALILLFLMIGLSTSTQIIAYPLVAENSSRILTAMSVSVVNISIEGGSGLLQPFFGYLMDKHMMHRLHHLTHHFVPSDFGWAIWLFPLGFIIALLAMISVPETFCKQRDV